MAQPDLSSTSDGNKVSSTSDDNNKMVFDSGKMSHESTMGAPMGAFLLYKVCSGFLPLLATLLVMLVLSNRGSLVVGGGWPLCVCSQNV